MDLAIRFDDSVIRNISVSRMDLLPGSLHNSDNFVKNCQNFGASTENFSITKYKAGAIKIFLKLSPACISTLKNGIQSLRIEVHVGQEGEMKFFDIQKVAFLELNLN